VVEYQRGKSGHVFRSDDTIDSENWFTYHIGRRNCHLYATAAKLEVSMFQRHYFFSAAVLLAGISLIGTPLAAQSPNGVPPSDATASFVFPAGPGFCSFPVTFSVQGKFKLIELGDRLITIAPAQKGTVTNNTDPSKRVTLNITGSFHITLLPNGNQVYDVTGRNLLFGGTLKTLTLAIGNFTFTLDANFNEISPLQGKGTLTDVCAAIK